MEELIRDLLRVLCPHLKAMAANTRNPVDNMIVAIICGIAHQGPTKE